VIVSASVWQERSYPLECRPDATENDDMVKPHTLMIENFEFDVQTFYEGTVMYEPF